MAKRFGVAGNQLVHTRTGGEAEEFGLGRSFTFTTDFLALASADAEQAILVVVNDTPWGLDIDEIDSSSSFNNGVQFRVKLNPTSHAAPTVYVPLSLNRMKPQVFKGQALISDGTTQVPPVGGTLISQALIDRRAGIGEKDGIILAPGDSIMVSAEAISGNGLVSVAMTGYHL